MSAFCEQCGAPLGEAANFCAACGTKVSPRTTADEPPITEEFGALLPSESPASESSAAQAPHLPPPRQSGSGYGLVPPLEAADGSEPKSRKRWLYALGAVIGIAIVIGIIAAAATGSKGASSAVHKCSYYPKSKPRPQTCISALAGAACLSYNKGSKPADCLSISQAAAQKRAAKRAAARARVAAKRAAVKARAAARRAARRAAAEAKARAAAIAAANAWHKGYHEQSGSVFWKWSNSGSCADYAQNGCWHVVVITKFGCPSYVAVNANEYQGKSIVGQLLANQGYGIPPKTPRRFELDADTGNVTAGDVTVNCE